MALSAVRRALSEADDGGRDIAAAGFLPGLFTRLWHRFTAKESFFVTGE
jgi:hypothetical protein